MDQVIRVNDFDIDIFDIETANEKNERSWFSIDIFKEVLAEHSIRSKKLNKKHPWFEILYNWILALVIIALTISLIVWGISVYADKKAESLASIALQNYQEELRFIEETKQAELAAEAALEENIIKSQATDAAKMIYGIRNFIEKYGYSTSDLKTYVRCAIDRYDFNNGSVDFHEIVAQDGQFLAYYETNPVLDEYYKIAYEEISTWHNETSKPWDSSFRFAELREDGIWLTNEFGANGYARRVQYS